MNTRSGDAAGASATVVLTHADGRSVERTATGDGPVDAAFKAIEAITGINAQLRKFELHSVSSGEDAQGEAVVYVDHNQRSYRGASVSTDIVESSARAFLEVMNRIEQSQRSQNRVEAERSGIRKVAQAAV
jgi:2-isopropylmalate synthase